MHYKQSIFDILMMLSMDKSSPLDRWAKEVGADGDTPIPQHVFAEFFRWYLLRLADGIKSSGDTWKSLDLE